MAYMEIITLTYQWLDELKASKDYQKMVELNNLIKTKYKKELKEYHTTFKQFEAVFKYGTYHPDFKTVSKQYQQAKIALFETEEVKTYFELEKNINETLNKLSNALNDIIPKGAISCVK